MKQRRERNQDDSADSVLSGVALLAAVDGKADEETQAYLRTHPHARREVELMSQVQGYLRARLYRLFCPTSELLIEYRLGLLAPEQSVAITEHVAACPHCAEELGLLEAMDVCG
jgi:anti-sigma factor RsiW